MLKEIRKKKTQFLNKQNQVFGFRPGLIRSEPGHIFRYPKKRVPGFPPMTLF